MLSWLCSSSTADMEKLGIYLHIPFCLSKCAYCDFYSLFKPEYIKPYFSALLRNIGQLGERYRGAAVDTIFIGGGTPSSVDSRYIVQAIQALSGYFRIEKDAEITIETNPATLDCEKLSDYRSCGINRLSIGLQSADDHQLKLLGRIHSKDDFLKSFSLASRYFDNLNIDIMTCIPDETPESAAATLEFVRDLSPKHISSYMLKIEDDTPFGRNREKYRFPDEDICAEIFKETDRALTESGYIHYEISNFAMKGYESRHNIRYWEGGNYLAFGPAAHSYIGNIRYSYKRDIEEYIRCSSFDEMIDECVRLSGDDLREEGIMLGLRMSKGINISVFRRGSTLRLIDEQINCGNMKRNGDRVSLTSDGMLVSNYIISDILLSEEK